MHRDLAWIPSWVARYPDRPWLAAANRLWSVPGLDGFRETKGFPKPVEPYGLYDGRFPGYFDEHADAGAIEEANQKLLPPLRGIQRWHGRPRLMLKMVGRPVKIELFERLSRGATFVHIVRDLKPTVASLLKVDFFERTGRIDDWSWGDIPASYREFLEESDNAPEAVAAVQYSLNRMELARQMSAIPADRRMVIEYSGVVADPVERVREIARMADLPLYGGFERQLAKRRVYGGADRKWEKQLSAQQIARLDAFEELALAHQGAAS
jgi:hypothetical protein